MPIHQMHATEAENLYEFTFERQAIWLLHEVLNQIEILRVFGIGLLLLGILLIADVLFNLVSKLRIENIYFMLAIILGVCGIALYKWATHIHKEHLTIFYSDSYLSIIDDLLKNNNEEFRKLLHEANRRAALEKS
jgi:thiol:disulfide interchange protein